MSDNIAINVKNLNKVYKIYPKKSDRFLEVMLFMKNRYTKFNALTDVSFKLEKGHILGIVGSNGAGKSTLLKIITGVTKPTSGEVEINGKIASLLELGAAFNYELTGIQNIYQQGEVMGLNHEQIKEKVEEIVEFSGIGDNVNNLVKTYSSGMFARLAFASAISMEFDILLVDEILSVGDTSYQNKCINKMKELTENGKTILYVSHDLHSIKYFCDSVIRLDHGRIIEHGTNVMEIVERYEKNIHLIEEEKEEEMIFANDSDIVTINKVSIIDKDGKAVTRVRHQDKMTVRIEYELYNYQEGMFFGVGMRNGKGEYINGMNTKQGEFQINKTPRKICFRS